MGEELEKSGYHPADINGDNKVDEEERKMYLEFKRKELEDADGMRDAQRKMTWFALAGMLLYPRISTPLTPDFAPSSTVFAP